jgi:hypothetical protein
MPNPTNESVRGPWRSLRRLIPISLAVMVTLTFGTVDAWAKANTAQPTTQAPAPSVTETRARLEEALPFPLAVAVDEDLAAYAQREAEAMALEDFHGGDVVVIGGTGLAIALLIVLVIVLL